MTDRTKFDCQAAFARLDDFVDRELAPEELALVEEHLRECGRCAPHFQFEHDVLDGVRRQVSRIRAPEGLREMIAARLRTG